MGKRSVRENKNIYQLSRERLNLTREAASDKMVYISDDRIEKIESERSLPHPDEILVMADVYKAPNLCNYYCSHECPIGQKHVPEITSKDLSQITLEILAKLNAMEKEKNRLIEITVDGEVSQDEYEDFANIQKLLSEISLSVDTLKLWVAEKTADGKIEKGALD